MLYLADHTDGTRRDDDIDEIDYVDDSTLFGVGAICN